MNTGDKLISDDAAIAIAKYHGRRYYMSLGFMLVVFGALGVLIKFSVLKVSDDHNDARYVQKGDGYADMQTVVKQSADQINQVATEVKVMHQEIDDQFGRPHYHKPTPTPPTPAALQDKNQLGSNTTMPSKSEAGSQP